MLSPPNKTRKLLGLLFLIVLEVLANAIGQENKGIEM